jgi:hypothetical protein
MKQIIFSGLVLCLVQAQAAVSVGDKAQYETYAFLALMGKVKEDKGTLTRSIISVDAEGIYTLRERRSLKSEELRDTLDRLLFLEANEPQDPDQLLATCGQFPDSKVIVIQLPKGKTMSGCEIMQGRPNRYTKRVYAPIPLYIYLYETYEKSEQGELRLKWQYIK